AANPVMATPDNLNDGYNSYSFGDYDFFQTKTRSFAEMQRTSFDPKNMESFAGDFKANNLNIDYDVLDFDVYQDINNGFMLALPSGTTLNYSKEYSLFSVDLSDFPDGEYFDLFYYMMDNKGDPVNEVISAISEDFDKDVKGLSIDPRYSKSFQLTDEWIEDYVLLNGNEIYDDENLGPVATSFYLNIISNDKVAFYSLAVCYVPASRTDINAAFESGIDCIDNHDANAKCCDYFESLMQIIVAAHLTTIASLY
ncbi:MAG: hypothetical protein ABI729_07560, partial [Chitinophagales bacterium]